MPLTSRRPRRKPAAANASGKLVGRKLTPGDVDALKRPDSRRKLQVFLPSLQETVYVSSPQVARNLIASDRVIVATREALA